MDLLTFIKQSVDETMRDELKGQESLFNLCFRHDRKEKLIERITHEVDLASKKVEVSKDTVKELSSDFTKMFIRFAKTHREHQLITDCQKDAMNRKQSLKDEAEQLWNEIVVDRSRVETFTANGVTQEAF